MGERQLIFSSTPFYPNQELYVLKINQKYQKFLFICNWSSSFLFL